MYCSFAHAFCFGFRRNVVALAVTLVFVSFSVLSGARVTLCTSKPNAEYTAGFLSAALFSWFSPVIDVGQTKQLDLNDLPVQVGKPPAFIEGSESVGRVA